MKKLFAAMFAAFRATFAKPGRVPIYLVSVTAAISVYHYARASASDPSIFVALMCLGLAVIILHWYGAGKIISNWYEGRPVAMFFWCVVVLSAIAWEGRSQLGLASNNQDAVKATRVAGWHTTEDARSALTFAATKLGAERKALEALRARVEAAASLSINGKPVTSPDVAQAEVDRLKGNVRFWTLTKGCTEAPGKQTREYCDAYRAALAAKATAENRLVLEAEAKRQETIVSEAEAAHVKAKEAVAATPTVVSEERADIATIKRLASLSTADAELSNSLLLWVVTFVILTIGGALEKSEEYAGKKRKPWFNLSGIRYRLMRLWDKERAEKMRTSFGVIERHTTVERFVPQPDPAGAAFAAKAR